MPARHSFLGFAGPVDRGTRRIDSARRAFIPPLRDKKGGPRPDAKKPRALGAARGEVGGPRGVAIATRRCDSATPSFIPPLNNKEERPGSRHLAALPSKKGRQGRPDGLWFASSVVA